MWKYIQRALLVIVLTVIAYGGYFLWTQAEQGPSEKQVQQAVEASLKERVPVQIIHFAGYRVRDGEDGTVDKVYVLKIGKAENDQHGREYWPVTVVVKGECSVVYGTRKEGGAVYGLVRERHPFEGTARYHMYRTAAYGQKTVVDQAAWAAKPYEVTGDEPEPRRVRPWSQ
ncbi:MAG: hypothetical protein AB1402_09600 [Bacillota bacterium]|jgi:hypothetical protein